MKALGEKTGRTLFGQLTDLNKKISEVNLQVGNIQVPSSDRNLLGQPFRKKISQIQTETKEVNLQVGNIQVPSSDITFDVNWQVGNMQVPSSDRNL